MIVVGVLGLAVLGLSSTVYFMDARLRRIDRDFEARVRREVQELARERTEQMVARELERRAQRRKKLDASKISPSLKEALTRLDNASDAGVSRFEGGSNE